MHANEMEDITEAPAGEIVAMFGVHWGSFFMGNKGIEYTVALLGMSLALIIAGGGQASVDQMLMNTRGRRRF